MTPPAPGGVRVRPAAVAGTFYPARRDALASTIDADLEAAADRVPVATDARQPKALIVPHAGYVYSGPVAAHAYALLAPFRDRVRRVVLLGPAHRVAVRCMALSSADAWETPLGSVAIDAELRRRILAMKGVEVDDQAHAPEHALEVQVPFLQRVLGDGWTLLPIVVGAADADEIADVLDAVWGGDDTLIVISSDLSHYHPYGEAQGLDARTADEIVAGHAEAIHPDDACGAYPVRGMLSAAGRHGLHTELLDLRNSGDTAGPLEGVVGYGAFALFGNSSAVEAPSESAAMRIREPARRALLDAAEEAIRAALEGRPASRGADDPALDELGACFVTLRDGERLLGCVGSMKATRPLGVDAADNALGAAFRDPRMADLTADEFARMSVHISVLSPLEAFPVRDHADLVSRLRQGVDGLLIDDGRHHATFLPAVWDQLPAPGAFLEHLWLKAGLRPGAWSTEMRVWRYHTKEFGNDGPRMPIRRPSRN